MNDDDFGMGLEPFDPKKHKPHDVGHGGPSTELLATEYGPDGMVWNIPTMWWTKEGKPMVLPLPDAMRLAEEYEIKTKKKFPRFRSIDDGVNAAKGRSAQGGATRSYLAAPLE